MARPQRLLSALLLALLGFASACSSGSDGGDANGLNADGDSNEIAANATTDSAAPTLSDGSVACGPVAISPGGISQAGGRLEDRVVLAFETVGLPLVAPELWAALPSEAITGGDPDVVVVIDPEPLAGASSYWVRVAQPGSGTSYDGVCSFATPSSTGSLTAPSTCSVASDGLAATVVWQGADPGASIAVQRDGSDLLVLAPTSLAPEVASAYVDRRALHTEPPAPGSSAEPGSGGYSDVTADAGTTHSYSLQAVGEAGDRSEVVECGEVVVRLSDLAVSCSVVTEALGFPVVSWEGAGTAQVVVFRDGIALEPSDVAFTSPFVDREAPTGVAASYTITAGDNPPVPCGSVTSDASTSGPADLQRAATENVIDHKGPFEYVTLEPICEGCNGTVVELYLVPDLETDRNLHKVQTVWVNGVEDPTAKGIWLLDPLFVGPLLLDAEADGTSIDYTIDPNTGLIVQWTVGGEGALMTCFEIDTRPIDMRERCGSQNKLS